MIENRREAALLAAGIAMGTLEMRRVERQDYSDFFEEHFERCFDETLQYRFHAEAFWIHQGGQGHEIFAGPWAEVFPSMKLALTLYCANVPVLAALIDTPKPVEVAGDPNKSRFESVNHDDKGSGTIYDQEDWATRKSPPAEVVRNLAWPKGYDMQGMGFDPVLIVEAAIAAHQANKAYCESIGDTSQVDFGDAPDWQRESALNGVCFAIANKFPAPAVMHENWMKEKVAAGWVYGEVKDPNAVPPTHPCIVPYDQLPAEQRAKDDIFRGTIMEVLQVTESPTVAETAGATAAVGTDNGAADGNGSDDPAGIAPNPGAIPNVADNAADVTENTDDESELHPNAEVVVNDVRGEGGDVVDDDEADDGEEGGGVEGEDEGEVINNDPPPAAAPKNRKKKT